MNEEQFEEFQTDKLAFYQAMSGEASLDTVIKAAIFIENQIIQLIEENVYDVKAINRMQLTYEGRVNLAIALGLKDSLYSPLKSLAGC